MSSESAVDGREVRERQAPVEDLPAATRRILEAAFNRGEFEEVRETVAPDAIGHDPNLPRALRGMRGPEPFIRTVAEHREAFPDLRLTAEDTITDGEKVAARWRVDGTHRGDLRGLAPTGARVSVTGISITRWRDGKVAEWWVEWDALGQARQIGAAPAEGGLAERAGVAVQRMLARRLRKRASDAG